MSYTFGCERISVTAEAMALQKEKTVWKEWLPEQGSNLRQSD
jgi:hypothetical protein